MGAPDLLRYLREAGFTVAPTDGGGIRVAPSAALTDAHRQAIRDHRAELLSLLASSPVADPDRWCWPHSAAMNGAELERFMQRAQQFTRLGLTTDDADAMADRLVLRDREGDDRRLCLECSNLTEQGRCLAAWRGALPGADRRMEPVQTNLQRCECFGLKGGM
jgi:hypothetical protein